MLLPLWSNNLSIFLFFLFCDVMSFKYQRILIKNTSIREGFARKIERKYFSYYETSGGVLTARTKSLQKLFGKWVFVFPIIRGFALPENLILIIKKIADCWQISNVSFCLWELCECFFLSCLSYFLRWCLVKLVTRLSF